MTLRGFVLVLALMVPSAAIADPITVSGMWSPTVTPPSSDPTVLPLEATAFWSNPSWDGHLMGVAYLINAFNTENLEYLHNPDGSPTTFRFADEEQIVSQTWLFGITSRTGGVFGRNEAGALTYDSGYGPILNSWDNGQQFALFRIRGEETTRYILGIEDILLSESHRPRLQRLRHDFRDQISARARHAAASGLRFGDARGPAKARGSQGAQRGDELSDRRPGWMERGPAPCAGPFLFVLRLNRGEIENSGPAKWRQPGRATRAFPGRGPRRTSIFRRRSDFPTQAWLGPIAARREA